MIDPLWTGRGIKTKSAVKSLHVTNVIILEFPTYKTGYIVQLYYLQKIIKKKMKSKWILKKIQLQLLRDRATNQPFNAIYLTLFL